MNNHSVRNSVYHTLLIPPLGGIRICYRTATNTEQSIRFLNIKL